MNHRNFFITLNGNRDQAIQYLAGMAQDTRQVTLSVLKHLTKEEIDWQFTPGWNTIGALLDHISAVEHFFRIEFIEGRKLTGEENKMWEAALDMGAYLPKLIGIKSPEDYRQSLTKSGSLFLKALENVTTEQFTERRKEYDDINGSNLAWSLYHKVEDEIYHRGQISMIRKLYRGIKQEKDR